MQAACRCAFHLGMLFTEVGEHALASGWAGRAQRLLEEIGPDTVETGYVAHLLMFRHLVEDDYPAAVAYADEVLAVARRFGDPDLTAIGLAAVGRLGLYSGRVTEGLALFDEALAAVAAGEVSPVFAGHVYCVMIEGCQDVSDLGRAAAWTSALSRWAEAQPALVAFTGQCAVHRGQIFRLHGAFREAVDEYDAAIARYLAAATTAAAGLAYAERGDVLRILGELDAADASYEHAADHGFEPQPGLALLWLARGRGVAAVAAMRRLLSEKPDPVGRSKLLPAAAEILLAAGEADSREAAREAARELEGIARDFGSEPLRAAAAYAAGAVELAEGDPAGALPYLRTAVAGWSASPGAVRHRARQGPDRPVPARPGRRGVGDPRAGRGAADLPRARRRAGRSRAGRAAEPGRRLPRRPDRPRGRGAAAGRDRAEQPADRRRPGAQREDGRPAPEQHLRQARRGLAHRRGGVRLRARPGLSRPAAGRSGRRRSVTGPRRFGNGTVSTGRSAAADRRASDLRRRCCPAALSAAPEMIVGACHTPRRWDSGGAIGEAHGGGATRHRRR